MKIFSLLLLFIGIFFATKAQGKVTDKAVIKVPALTCELCKDRLEQLLFKTYGVNAVKADFKKHTVAVSWTTDRTTLEEIKTAIANAGFDADDVTAEEFAAKKLPPCCKKIVEKVVVVAPIKATEPINTPIVKPNTPASVKAKEVNKLKK